MKTYKVKITKARRPTYWYSPHIGEEFIIYDRRLADNSYIIKEDYDMGTEYRWRTIDKEDCEIIEEILRE